MNEYKVTAVSHITADSLESAELEYEGNFTPDSHEIELVTGDYTETDTAILLLCQTLDEIRNYLNSGDSWREHGEWVDALEESSDLLKAHAGDNDLSGME